MSEILQPESTEHSCLASSKVIDSRDTPKEGGIRRRRVCEICGKRWTTYECDESVLIAMAQFRKIQVSLQQSIEALDLLSLPEIQMPRSGRSDFNWMAAQDVYKRVFALAPGTRFTVDEVRGQHTNARFARAILSELAATKELERVNRWVYARTGKGEGNEH